MSYLAVDLGTTNIKAILYGDNLEPLAQRSEKVVYQKRDMRVEFDAEEYFDSLLRLIDGCCSQAYQLLLLLPPSTWWEAVAVPHKNPRGKWNVACAMVISFAAKYNRN